jgi:hypothetical protein
MQPKQKKYFGIAAGAAALLYYLFYSKAGNAKTDKTFTAEAEQLQLDTPGTYMTANYLAFADKLESAMFDAGTDEDSIYNVFKKLKNNTDFAKLFAAFGKRAKYNFGWSQGNWNLIQWLQDELSETEQDEINKILAAANITYRI